MLPRVLLGLLAGAVLASARETAGSELFTLPLVEAGRAATVRAAALLALGLGLCAAPRLLDGRRANGEVLIGLALGFAAGVLGIAWLGGPSTPWLAVGAALVVPWLCERLARRVAVDPADAQGAAGAPTSARWSTPLATFLAAAGAALALEALARPARARCGGTVLDVGMLGIAFTTSLALGGLVFGPALAGIATRARGRELAPLLALAAAAAFAGLLAATAVGSPEGFRLFLGRFGITPDAEGTWLANLLVGVLILGPPALVAGAALWAARRRRDLVPLVLGAAVGVRLAPLLLAIEAGASLEQAVSGARPLIAGAWVAAAGAGVAALGARAWSGRAASLAAALACAGLALGFPRRQVIVLPASTSLMVRHAAVVALPEGQLRVELARDEIQRVELDRAVLAPELEAARLDALALRAACALLPAERAVGTRVLLLGQLTPGRALTLTESGAASIDRSGAWWAAMKGIEDELFQGHPPPPAGEILAPARAHQRAADGAYDLVVVPPVLGSDPRVPHDMDLAPGTIAVAWFDAADLVARRAIERPVTLVADGLERLALGVVWGVEPDLERRAGGAPFLAAGPPASGRLALERLRTRSYARADASRLALARRLAAASTGGPWTALTDALARHLAAQRPSSPFETREQRVELDEEALTRLFEHALGGELDSFTREAWSGVAQVLVGQRDVESIYRFLEPLAETYESWPELATALATADLEELDPEGALSRLAPYATASTDPHLLSVLARAHEDAGDPAQAAAVWRRAVAARPGDESFSRSLALALFRVGDPEGRRMLEAILAEHPGDVTVAELLGDDPGGGGPR